MRNSCLDYPIEIDKILYMNDQIKQIAERLRGLREVLELTPEEVALADGRTLAAWGYDVQTL